MLPCDVDRWLAYLADVEVRHVTKEDRLFRGGNAVHVLVNHNIVAKQFLWNASLIVAHLLEIVSVTVF